METRNRIRELRARKGISQRGLASMVGTSQQQIQRVEAGTQAVRFDMALRICAALAEKMEKVFPGTQRALARSQSESQSLEQMIQDQSFSEEMERVCVDVDAVHWYVKFRLRGGGEKIFGVSSLEKDRLLDAVQGSDRLFVVFDSGGYRLALNKEHVTYWHFIFEAYPEDGPAEEEPEEVVVRVFLADGSVPLEFDVDRDEPEEAEEDDIGQFAALLMIAESCERDEIFGFMDADGETVYLRANDVAMMQVPFAILEPDLQDDEEEADAAVEHPSGGSPPESGASLLQLAEAIRERNRVNARISDLIGRPATSGNIGEFVASRVFAIELAATATQTGWDGKFSAGPMEGRTVNIKCYGEHSGMLNIGKHPCDYYLVLVGPPAAERQGQPPRTLPWRIDAVYLFESERLLKQLQQQGVKIGTATSVRKKLWDEARIYPATSDGFFHLTDQQIQALEAFRPAGGCLP